MKRLGFAWSLVLGLALSAVFTAGAGAGEMKAEEGMMHDTKMDMMSEKSGEMTHGKDMEMMETTMKDDDRMGMMPETRTGTLHGSKGHSASGKVIVTVGEMGPVLILENIEVDKVPDGRVYLARDADYRDGVELGHLKQFQGTVTFTIPVDVKPAEFNSVVIWCEKFNVEIGRATLAREKM